MLKSYCILLLFTVFALGCSHIHPRGTVVFLDNGKEGHVCLGHKEVKAGDKVQIYRSVCSPKERAGGRDGGSMTISCEKKSIGEGVVIENTGEHFARIRSLGDIPLETGLIVEK